MSSNVETASMAEGAAAGNSGALQSVGSAVMDADRLLALSRTGLKDQTANEELARIARLLKKCLASDVALISLVDDSEQTFAGSCGIPNGVTGTPLSHSFCRHVVEEAKPLIIRDSRRDDRVKDNPSIITLNVLAYIGAPLRAPSGQILGSVCAIHHAPRDWTNDDVQTVCDFAAIANDAIALRQQRDKAVDQANRMKLLAEEYNHRAKNFAAVARSLVNVSERDATTKAELAEAIRTRLASYEIAHSAIDRAAEGITLRELINDLLTPYGVHKSADDASESDVRLDEPQIHAVCLIIHELATNSAKYGAIANGSVPLVKWTRHGAKTEVVWDEETTMQPPAPSPSGRSGFGEELLGMAAMQLGGRFERDWLPNRMRASFTIDGTR